MIIGTAIVLAILALVFVLYPVWQHRSSMSSDSETFANHLDTGKEKNAVQNAESIELSEQEKNARNALQEVELDYQLGNIGEPEYQTLRERYLRRALLAMKSRHDREQEIDEEIEEQLRKMKETYEHAK